MKRTKRGLALILTAVMLVSCVTTILIAANKEWPNAGLGALSQYYETGNSADPGYISTVTGDSGGTSYGIYMFVEKTVESFMAWLRQQPSDSKYRNFGETLYEAYAYNTKHEYYPGFGSNFKNTWQDIARHNSKEFAEAQTKFWEENCYNTLVRNVEALFPGFDINSYSIALKNVFWSRSVHHGVGVTSGANSTDGKSGATGVIYRAFNRLGGFKMQSETELIQAIYAECSKLETQYKDMQNLTASKYGIKDRSMAYFNANSGGVQTAVYSRLHVNEPADALVMRYSYTSSPIPEGKYRLLDNGSNQALALSVDGNGSAAVEAASGTVLTLTYFPTGRYTLTTADGSRLTDNGGKVLLSPAAASDSQFWVVENGTLKNCGSGKFLSVDSASNSTYTVAADVSTVSKWHLSPVSGAGGWTVTGLFYPGCSDNDGIGNSISHSLTEGNSSFPLRGIVSYPTGVRSVVVTVSGSGGFSCSASSNDNWFDLWELDKSAKFSQLQQGDHTLTITATNASGETVTLVSAPLKVGARDTSISTGGSNERYTVTFVNGAAVTTKEYSLGETYGALPTVTTPGFQGWFLANGTEITSNSIVAAENHKVTAQFGALHKVTFVSEGRTVHSGQLAEGSLITAPSAPVKLSDKDYVYSFSYWQDQSGNRFTAGSTFMGGSDLTYTAVFTKTANTGGGTGGASGGEVPAPSNYMTGVTPGTSVESLSSGGYAVYDGSKKVTSGLVGTGMVAVSSTASVTIVVTGDVNGDGRITITDVVKLQNKVAGASKLTGAYALAGDINGDGKITITDVVQAAQVTVGQRTIN